MLCTFRLSDHSHDKLPSHAEPLLTKLHFSFRILISCGNFLTFQNIFQCIRLLCQRSNTRPTRVLAVPRTALAQTVQWSLTRSNKSRRSVALVKVRLLLAVVIPTKPVIVLVKMMASSPGGKEVSQTIPLRNQQSWRS